MLPSFVTDPNPSLYETGSWVCLDFETSNIDKGSALVAENRIVLACWITGQGTTVHERKYRWGSEFEMQELLADIASHDFIVAQNAKFELQWLDRCGHPLGSKPVYDTMMGEWVLSGNRGWPLDLDSLSIKYGAPTKGRIIKLMMAGGVSPEDMPRSLLLRYGMGDVVSTHAIRLGQLEAMQGTRLLPIVYTRCLCTLALSDIEKAGICLDPEEVEKEYESTLQEFVTLSTELEEFTGGINMNSGQQVGAFLYDTLAFDEVRNPYNKEPIRTAGGQRSTKADVLTKLVATTDRQRQFLGLQKREGKLSAALSKNLEFFLGVCREYGGIFYGNIRQGVARTHRLASSGRPLLFKAFPKPKSCQFQNLPNIYKRLIRTRHPGWLLCEADGSQLEFRVGGHLGNDQQIKDDVTHQGDIHSCTAEALTRAGEPTTRRAAKASTFKPMYGGTKGSPAVEAYCKFFAEKYHELNTAQKTWALVAANDGVIETEWGLRYYFTDVRVQHDGYIKNQQKVFNYPIQGFATGEIIPIGLVFFWYRTRNAELIITNTVHDSVTCEVPPNEIELFELAAVQSFTTDVYGYLDQVYNIKFSLPLGVSMKFGTHWGVTAYTDEELMVLAEPLRTAGYEPAIDDGEVSVDVPRT